MKLLLDTGPWVALHGREDRHHAWARTQFASHPGPFLTCEAVVAETCFRLARGGFDPAKAPVLVERGVVKIDLSLACSASVHTLAGPRPVRLMQPCTASADRSAGVPRASR